MNIDRNYRYCEIGVNIILYVDAILEFVKNKVASYGYKSAKFRLALIRESQPINVVSEKLTFESKLFSIIDRTNHKVELWKVSVARVILDVEDPHGQETLIKENNFALEDFSVPIDTFYQFLKYLDKADVRKITFENNVPNLSDDLLFTMGNYKLCFIGNFPSTEPYFFGRSVSKEYHGIDKPIYLADYSLHSSVIGNLHKIDLTGHEIPLRNAIDGINHFWGTNYEQYNLSNYCNIYMPVYEASISSCNAENNHLITTIDVNTERTKTKDLSISIIIEKPHEYRQRHNLTDNKLDVDLNFMPDYASVFLFKNKEKLDEYNFESLDRRLRFEQLTSQVNFGKDNSKIDNSSNITKEYPLLDPNLIRLLPKNVENLLIEAEKAFDNTLYRASAILMRSAMEELVTMALQKNGKESDLYDDRGEIALQRKVNLLTTIPQYKNLKNDLEYIKWFGDKAVHEASMPILKKDVENNVEPKLRLFLTKFAENNSYQN